MIAYNPSVTFGDSSLYTREPFAPAVQMERSLTNHHLLKELLIRCFYFFIIPHYPLSRLANPELFTYIPACALDITAKM